MTEQDVLDTQCQDCGGIPYGSEFLAEHLPFWVFDEFSLCECPEDNWKGSYTDEEMEDILIHGRILQTNTLTGNRLKDSIASLIWDQWGLEPFSFSP